MRDAAQLTFDPEVVMPYKSKLKETEKAWYLELADVRYWFPKSICVLCEDSSKIIVPKWFAKKMDEGGAIFSDDGKRRYVLWRTWNKNKKIALCIGLNPSTANQSKDDPTIRQLTHALIEREFGGFKMVNLFTTISPKPEALLEPEAQEHEDADLGIIFGQALTCQEVIFAWGIFKEAEQRAKRVIGTFPDAVCFGVSKSGAPWHPLALMYNGVKPEKTWLFKFKDHKYIHNISNKKRTKEEKARDELKFQEATQQSLLPKI